MHASVANAGNLDHPVNGASVVGIVAAAGSRKLTHLRIHQRVTVVLRSGRRGPWWMERSSWLARTRTRAAGRARKRRRLIEQRALIKIWAFALSGALEPVANELTALDQGRDLRELPVR